MGFHVAPWYWLMLGGKNVMELMGFDPMTSLVEKRYPNSLTNAPLVVLVIPSSLYFK
jgi:hypothetical protein